MMMTRGAEVPARAQLWDHGEKAQQTKQRILDASRKLFLERGYSATQVQDITRACGVSRATFYTYFSSRLEVFATLGTSTHTSLVAVIKRFGLLPNPCSLTDVRSWVVDYFAFLHEHGAFLISSGQTGPSEPAFHAKVLQLHARNVERLGRSIQERRGRSDDFAAVGLAVTAMLDHSWYHARGMRIAIDDDAVVSANTDMIYALLQS